MPFFLETGSAVLIKAPQSLKESEQPHLHPVRDGFRGIGDSRVTVNVTIKIYALEVPHAKWKR